MLLLLWMFYFLFLLRVLIMKNVKPTEKLKEYCNGYLYTYYPDSTVSFRHVCLIRLATHPCISLYFFAELSKSEVADVITSEEVDASSLRASRILRAVHIQILELLNNFRYRQFRSCTVNNIRYVNVKQLWRKYYKDVNITIFPKCGTITTLNT